MDLALFIIGVIVYYIINSLVYLHSHNKRADREAEAKQRQSDVQHGKFHVHVHKSAIALLHSKHTKHEDK